MDLGYILKAKAPGGLVGEKEKEEISMTPKFLVKVTG